MARSGRNQAEARLTDRPLTRCAGCPPFAGREERKQVQNDDFKSFLRSALGRVDGKNVILHRFLPDLTRFLAHSCSIQAVRRVKTRKTSSQHCCKGFISVSHHSHRYRPSSPRPDKDNPNAYRRNKPLTIKPLTIKPLTIKPLTISATRASLHSPSIPGCARQHPNSH